MTDARIEELIELYRKAEIFASVKKEDFTCEECQAKYICLWSFDLYNRNGECLASK
jgi:hypothetical protein